MTADETIVARIDSLKDESEKKPYLTFIKGNRLGQIHPLPAKGEVVVGRSPDADLWIEDSAISRRHFKMNILENRVYIEDLGSTNGTYINGARVTTRELSDGDKIQISKNTILELAYLDDSQSLSEKKRYEMGVMDPVTNIYNKRCFLDRINDEFAFALRKKRDLSLVMFDLDHFKSINDTYGHLAGDLVLQKVAGEISKTLRTDDLFARYGGEEFVILMRDASLKNAWNLAERIRKLVENLEISHDAQTFKVSISCGVAGLDETRMKDPNALVEEADRYLYQSKNQGRNRVSGPSPTNP